MLEIKHSFNSSAADHCIIMQRPWTEEWQKAASHTVTVRIPQLSGSCFWWFLSGLWSSPLALGMQKGFRGQTNKLAVARIGF